MKLTILGCGTSTGVPRVGNNWGKCDPANPRNRRTRVSVLIEQDDYRVLIDTTPDLRNQLLDNDVDRLDAVLWTHDHADHCHGIDDLRGLYRSTKKRLTGMGRPYTVEALHRRFGYVFEGNKGYPSLVELQAINDACPEIALGPFTLTWVDQPHGPVQSTGFVLTCDGKSVVYATDFSDVTDDMVECYSGCDVLVVDALRREPHPTHAHLDLAFALARRCNAARTILTHMDISMDYDDITSECSDSVEPGYDGLVLWI